PARVYVVGGELAVSQAVVDEIAALGLPTQRLGGPTRIETALAVGDELWRLVGEDEAREGFGVVAVNLRQDFTHVLSATAVAAALPGLFLPLEGEDGSIVTASTRAA